MINFTKMHGLGNDFVVIDAVTQAIDLTLAQIRFIADRHLGIGCDQLLLIEKPDVGSHADFKYRIFNADGSEVGQCGNGVRCLARFVRDKQLSQKQDILVDTNARQLLLRFDDNDLITVNMGVPLHAPADIPLLTDTEALSYHISVNDHEWAFGAVSMGNPHAVIQVDNLSIAPVNEVGKALESHRFFPEKANIGFMQILNRQQIKLRVFERGAGETRACGSGACAAAVVGIEQKLLDSTVKVALPGGDLTIQWQGRGQPVFMTGPAVSVFDGQIML
ncbi:MAG: diaminopimelate epimerase [Methylococcales bacterium]